MSFNRRKFAVGLVIVALGASGVLAAYAYQSDAPVQHVRTDRGSVQEWLGASPDSSARHPGVPQPATWDDVYAIRSEMVQRFDRLEQQMELLRAEMVSAESARRAGVR